MLIAVSGALAALFSGHNAGQTVADYRIANWRVHVATDRFTGLPDCRISRDGATYGPRYVTFQLPKNINTYTAAYRIDDEAPKEAIEPVEDVETLNMARLENPSMGRVRIPVAEVMDAGRIMIHAKDRGRVSTFKITGLREAVDFAKSRGCVE